LPKPSGMLPKGNVTVTIRLCRTQLLDQFEELYRMHVADRDGLERELAEISK
jgi:hypothetical protein